MTEEEFRKLPESGVVLLDGATGTNLQKAGMPAGVCPEQWILKNSEILLDLQTEYLKAGSNIIYTPTFSGNRIKLAEYGLENEIEFMNRELVKLSKQAVRQSGGKGLIAGDLTMTGEQLYPVGRLSLEELINIYKEQISYMLLEGVDLFVIETMMSLSECRAALLAVKENCDLPVMITLTFNEGGRTFYGTEPETAAVVLQSMGANAVGVNCSTGPDKMCEIVRRMRRYAEVPIVAKPNAGLPKLSGDQTVFDMEPEEFASGIEKLVEAGAAIVGGCCGTTPEHIKRLDKIRKRISPLPIEQQKKRVLTTERKYIEIDTNGRFLIVGERINPTGKKALQAELKESCLDIVSSMAVEQTENGADILDINMGMNGIDEKEMMLKAMNEVMRVTDTPLCIDSSHVSVIEAALREYPGRALINSISLEKDKLEKLLPSAKKYGAMFILLPLSEKGLPKDIDEKKQIIKTIMEAAFHIGMKKEDIIVDGLVNTVGANKNAAIETLETIRYCKQDLELATIVGLSNISFGLPQRQFVNSTFLALAIREGLTMAIANPNQDLLVNTALGADMLLGKEGADKRYIERVTEKPVTIKENAKPVRQTEEAAAGKLDPVYEAVIKGSRNQIVSLVKEKLKEKADPSEIINTTLIPAINQVGELFDKQIYFLPQLISSAETMRTAIDYLEPMLKKEEHGGKKGTIVIATVAGDIHDIGKNLVALMFKNYGFEVIDLGKDVPSELIIRTAREKDADIIALSALMTTTMLEMRTVVQLAKKEGLRSFIIVGGAAITQSYAEEIGADGYSKDAGEAVKLVKHLLKISD